MKSDVEDMVQFIIQSHEKYERVEDTVLEILDESLKSHIEGNQNQVRNQLRNFAQSKMDVFRFLSHAVSIDDEEKQILSLSEDREDALESIEFLRDRYEDLRPAIIAVYLEIFNDRLNPIDSYDIEIGYREEVEEPMILFEASTGGLRLFETRMSASSMSHMSRSTLEGVTESIESAHDSDVPISDEEYKRIEEVTESIRSQLSQLESALEEVNTTENK
jgi:hypothetical protein